MMKLPSGLDRKWTLGALVLIAAAALWFTRGAGTAGMSAAMASNSAGAEQSEAPHESDETRAVRARQREIAARPWPASPFLRPNVAGAAASEVPPLPESPERPSRAARPDFVLSAIFDGQPRRAMVNGRIVGVGDELCQGIRVVEIGAFDVRLTADGAAVTLSLPK